MKRFLPFLFLLLAVALLQAVDQTQGENDPAFSLKLKENSFEAAWYQEMIERYLKPWLVRYPKSKFVPEMEAKLKSFQEELDRIKKGDHRLGEHWYTAAEYEANRPEFEANRLANLRTAIALQDYVTMAALLNEATERYDKTKAFPEMVALGKLNLAHLEPEKVLVALQKRLVSAEHEMDQVVARVQAIVNQVPPRVAKPPGAESFTYEYQEGALKPDFEHADLVSTRERWKGSYVQIRSAPNIFYLAKDCEFNPQTKYFYTRRDVPKKLLTDGEIKEVVRLYRILAKYEKLIAELKSRMQNVNGFISELQTLHSKLQEIPIPKP